MKIRRLALLVIMIAILFAGAACGISNPIGSTTTQTTTSASEETPTSATSSSVRTTTVLTEDDGIYDPGEATVIVLSDEAVVLCNDNGFVSVEAGVVTILAGGTYRLQGESTVYAVAVTAGDEDVALELSDLMIESDLYAPIAVHSADKVVLVLKDGATARLIDNRPAALEETDDLPNAALYAACDMNISGFGTLIVEAAYNNGIGSKDDLKIAEATIRVTAANHGIKGSDSLSIASGTIFVTAVSGDGLKTSNSDVSSKGNQRGTILISGGSITIHAACDGIDAAYDLVIEGDPEIEIHTTQTYATGVGEGASASESTLYVRLSASSYNASYRYAFYFTQGAAGSGTWANATYAGSQNIMGRIYHFYEVDMPTSATHYALYRFLDGAENSTVAYNAKSSTALINASFDTLAVSVSGSNLSVNWTNSQSSGNTGLAYSAKGLKADNEIRIQGGTIVIESYDDGVHANSDTMLENGGYGTGKVTISGGSVTITTKDDGVHADTHLIVSGGTVKVLASYEGLEACDIAISGGTIALKSTDDGVNAKTGSVATRIVVSGGIIDITVGTGDTDAIDSNGSYLQTGGFVVSRSALSGGMGGALDAETTVSITGGTFIGLGQSEIVAASAGQNRSTGKFNLSIAAGTYEVKNASGVVLFTFETETTYSQIWMSSEWFQAGQTYRLVKGSTTVKTWTQS
jgi:hypothetical protein